MLAGSNVERPQNVVDTSQLSRLTVDGGRPTRIIVLREDDDASPTRLHIVGEVVRLVGYERYERGLILLGSLAQLLLKALVGNSLMAQIELLDGIYLGIGIVNIADLVDKPGVAVGVWILYGHRLSSLQRHDDVARVEHVEHREDGVAIHFRHITGSIGDGRHECLHLGHDVVLYHLLIAAQLGSMIAADALVVIARLVLVERVRSHVEHTVVALCGGVLKNHLVGLGELLRSLALALRNKHVVAEIALVDRPHV